jgi:HK97 family phage prohead protease
VADKQPVTIEVTDPNFIIRRDDAMVFRSIREDAREVDFIASTTAIDSYDEVVDQSWDLSAFQKNPVILWAHDRYGLPIGKAPRTEVVNGQLETTIKFAEAKLSEHADQVFRMVVAEYIRAVSVGFKPRTIRWEKRDGKDIYVLSNNQLREISVCSVGANPEALAKSENAPIQLTAREMFERSFRSVSGTPRSFPTPQTARKTAPETNSMSMDSKPSDDIIKLSADLAVAKKEIADKEKALEIATTASDALKATAKAFEEKAASLQRDLDAKDLELVAEKAKRAEIEGKMVERAVDDLVGKRIVPAQRDAFVALAKKDFGSFEAVVKTLPELPLDDKSKIGPSTLPDAPAAPGEEAVPQLGAKLASGSDTKSAEGDLGSLL